MNSIILFSVNSILVYLFPSLKPIKKKSKVSLINNALACCKLAEMGIDSKENLEIAVSLCERCQEIFHKTSADYAVH